MQVVNLERATLVEAADVGRELRPLRNQLEHHTPAQARADDPMMTSAAVNCLPIR